MCRLKEKNSYILLSAHRTLLKCQLFIIITIFSLYGLYIIVFVKMAFDPVVLALFVVNFYEQFHSIAIELMVWCAGRGKKKADSDGLRTTIIGNSVFRNSFN